MSPQDKVRELARKCEDAILPLIDQDYYLFSLPYHNNIGDILIWEGELELLKKSPHKCLGVCGWNSYSDTPMDKDKDILILIHGGGYMGDVWRHGWQQVINCMKRNPHARFVVLPNTLHYDDLSLAVEDRKVMEQCANLTLCMRDLHSLARAKELFPSISSIPVPDTAFCIAPHLLRRLSSGPRRKYLLVKRTDKELASAPIPEAIMALNPDVSDWPPMEVRVSTGQYMMTERIFNFVVHHSHKLIKRGWAKPSLIDRLYLRWYRPMMVRNGVKFLSPYNRIYTTRLHVMILSVLLGRECYMLDNSYGKLSNFYRSWLSDCDNIHVWSE